MDILMNLKKNARIGVWGYGVVGKAVVHYFHNQGYQISVMDTRNFTQEECAFFHEKRITMYNEKDKKQFFIIHDYLFSSSGVNIANDYPTYSHKWLHEL